MTPNDLKNYRAARNFIQAEAAIHHGISKSLWEKMEQGRRSVPHWLVREIGSIAVWHKRAMRNLTRRINRK